MQICRQCTTKRWCGIEYEAAERSLQLQQKQPPGKECLLEVIRCYVENLEDYQARSQARDLAWDAEDQRLVPLDAPRRAQMSEEICRRMEPGFVLALQAATAGAGPRNLLPRRHARLRSECATLLDLKTEATHEHYEKASKLRREVVLFQVMEHLESSALGATATQSRTALSMFDAVEATAPTDAVERLRERLNHLAGGARSDLRP